MSYMHFNLGQIEVNNFIRKADYCLDLISLPSRLTSLTKNSHNLHKDFKKVSITISTVPNKRV